MKSSVSFGLGAISGALIGGGIGYLLCRHLGEVRIQERIAAEREELRAHYLRRAEAAERHANNDAVAKLVATAGNGVDDLDGGPAVAGSTLPALPPSDGRSVRDIIHKMRYDRIIDPGIDIKLVPAAPPAGTPDEASEPEVDITVPHVISINSFCEDELGFQKLCFTFYAEDGVLVDDKEGLLEDPLGTVGEALESKFGQSDGADANTVYIRNYRLECDFEVSRHQGSYSVMVLGEHPYPESPDEAPNDSRELCQTGTAPASCTSTGSITGSARNGTRARRH